MTRRGLVLAMLLNIAIAVSAGCHKPAPTRTEPTTTMPMLGQPTTQATTKPATTAPAVAWGKAVNGLRIGLSTDKADYRPGDDVLVTISLQNVSGKPLACVLPSNDPKSDFPFLVELKANRIVHQPAQDVRYWGVVPLVADRQSSSMNPGEKEFSLAPQDNVQSCMFKLNTADIAKALNQGKAVQPEDGKEFGDYELSAAYFIRASTPKYGPSQDPKLKGALLWAGHAATSADAKFAVAADLPGSSVSLADAMRRDSTFVAVCQASVPSQDNVGRPWTSTLTVLERLAGQLPRDRELVAEYPVSRTERPIFAAEKMICVISGPGPAQYQALKFLPDAPANRKLVRQAATRP